MHTTLLLVRLSQFYWKNISTENHPILFSTSGGFVLNGTSKPTAPEAVRSSVSIIIYIKVYLLTEKGQLM